MDTDKSKLEDCTKIDFDLTQFGDQTLREQITPRPGQKLPSAQITKENILNDISPKRE